MEAKKLDTKLKQLKLTVDRTGTIVESNQQDAIERHCATIKSITNSINEMRVAVEEIKIQAETDITEITAWNTEIDNKLAESDKVVEELRTWLDQRRKEKDNVARDEQIQFETMLFKTRMEFETKLASAKVETLTINKEGNLQEGYNKAKSILKDRYGKESEIIKSYVKDIMDLPYIHGANPKKIRDFSERLNHCVQALQTMNRLSQVNGNVAMTLDKLPGIRGDLVRTDPDWERWTFVQLSEAVRQWVKRNPVDQSRTDRDKDRQIKSFHAKSRECVYCGDVTHKAGNCTKITSVTERKQILARKRLCFNCAIGTHRAAECSSKGSCQNCGKRHHTSICDTSKVEGKEQVMTTNQSS
ncbi:Collagen alpha-1(XXVII) chain B [Paramuricea clavata]|uniref:Collagen alpha-1(XXVII) chain B n=1 Tax=Paramuricea clavata TaxID=317549 RepID=A0A6S7H1E3_PARCT|nr:Collagen alpha-1(XXVII) chain B [Paramuricea clavata]